MMVPKKDGGSSIFPFALVVFYFYFLTSPFALVVVVVLAISFSFLKSRMEVPRLASLM